MTDATFKADLTLRSGGSVSLTVVTEGVPDEVDRHYIEGLLNRLQMYALETGGDE